MTLRVLTSRDFPKRRGRAKKQLILVFADPAVDLRRFVHVEVFTLDEIGEGEGASV